MMQGDAGVDEGASPVAGPVPRRERPGVDMQAGNAGNRLGERRLASASANVALCLRPVARAMGIGVSRIRGAATAEQAPVAAGSGPAEGAHAVVANAAVDGSAAALAPPPEPVAAPDVTKAADDADALPAGVPGASEALERS
jgi:hypothetical protein